MAQSNSQDFGRTGCNTVPTYRSPGFNNDDHKNLPSPFLGLGNTSTGSENSNRIVHKHRKQ